MRRRFSLALGSVLVLMLLRPMSGQVIKSAGCSVDLEILELSRCAVVTKGDRMYISAAFVRPLFKGVTSHLASTYLPDGGWAYFDRTGLVRVKGVVAFDNGASYFHFGLVRVVRDGRYGLATDRGVLVTPLFDGMGEFDEDDEVWKACNLCRLVSAGEYSWFEGGNSFWLNRRGRVTGRAAEAH